ncbi:hypothetical protein [Spirosoma areae]
MTEPTTASPPDAQSPVPGQLLNTCLLGQGITCGLLVQLKASSSITVGSGTAILPNGTVLSLKSREFWNYRKQPKPEITAYFGKTKIWELTDEEPSDSDSFDSIVPQYRTDDQPGSVFLDDKIMVVYVNERADQPLTFLLIRQVDMVRLKPGLEADVRRLAEPTRSNQKPGIFANPRTALSFDTDHIEAALFPYRQLPHIALPRFGYKTLALINKNRAWDFDDKKPSDKLDNLRPPFGQIKNFDGIFKEYKTILDEAFPAFKLALRVLHAQFGSLLTDEVPAQKSPKSQVARPKTTTCTEPVQDHFATYREVLCRKWQVFKEEGDHLYYIQYFYDWLADMLNAYEEFRCALTDFSAECLCDEPKPDPKPVNILLLGPVINDDFTYKPLIFRDYFKDPFTYNHNEERLREVRCLHQRLMMMIWTFDLPGLQLERNVLVKGGYVDRAEEYEDSTDYWEKLAPLKNKKDKSALIDLNQLPVRLTPGRALDELLGQQAIPYYYPLDADSPYSLHRFWEYYATKTNRINRHLSYNAYRGDDAYTDQPDILFPLAFTIRQLPFLRAEGHIGRLITREIEIKKADGTLEKVPVSIVAEIREIIRKYNLGIEVIGVDITNKSTPATDEVKGIVNLSVFTAANSPYSVGLEHQNGGYAGQTLVLFFVAESEQIELNECKKDKTPEVDAFTIVADFTLPYRFSCCYKTTPNQ